MSATARKQAAWRPKTTYEKARRPRREERNFHWRYRQRPKRRATDFSFEERRKSAVYNGDEFREIYKLPLLFGLLSLLMQLPFSVRKDIKRRKQMRYGRRLKGPERLTPKEFNRKVRGDGIGITTDGLTEMVRIPAQAEAQHVQITALCGIPKRTICQFERTTAN
jgi:hypothetical protein